GCLQTVLERGEREEWFQSPFIVGMAVASAGGLVRFLAWGLRPGNKAPPRNPRGITNRHPPPPPPPRSALRVSLYGGVFVIPQFLQSVQGHTAEQAGLLLLPSGLAAAGTFILVGILVNKVDTRLLIGVGACVLTFAMLELNRRLTLTTPDEAYFFPLVLRGAGLGLQIVPLSVVALATLKPQPLA